MTPPISSVAAAQKAPPEILWSIFGYLSDPALAKHPLAYSMPHDPFQLQNLGFRINARYRYHILLPCTRVCHSWNHSANVLLYEHIEVSSSVALESLLSTLDSTLIGTVVKSLSLVDGFHPEGDRDFLEVVHSRCANLRHVRADAHMTPADFEWRDLLQRLQILSVGPTCSDLWLASLLRPPTSTAQFTNMTELRISGGQLMREWPIFSRLRSLFLQNVECDNESIISLFAAVSWSLEVLKLLKITLLISDRQKDVYTAPAHQLPPPNGFPSFPRLRQLAITYSLAIRKLFFNLILKASPTLSDVDFVNFPIPNSLVEIPLLLPSLQHLAVRVTQRIGTSHYGNLLWSVYQSSDKLVSLSIDGWLRIRVSQLVTYIQPNAQRLRHLELLNKTNDEERELFALLPQMLVLESLKLYVAYIPFDSTAIQSRGFPPNLRELHCWSGFEGGEPNTVVAPHLIFPYHLDHSSPSLERLYWAGKLALVSEAALRKRCNNRGVYFDTYEPGSC